MEATHSYTFIDDQWASRSGDRAKFESLASTHIGLCSAVNNIAHRRDEIHAFYTAITSCNFHELLGTRSESARNSLVSGGGGYTSLSAWMSAMGETVERYSALHTPYDHLIVNTWENLSTAAVTPTDCALFAGPQYATPGFKYVPFTEQTRTSWVEGIDLHKGRSALLPAQLVYLDQVHDDCDRIGYSTSNGLACGTNRSEAVVSALFEAAERDAVMTAWHARLRPPRLDLHSDPRIANLLDLYMSHAPVEITALDLTEVNGFPVCLAIVRSPQRAPGYFGIGAASRASIKEAAHKALEEAFHTLAYTQNLYFSGRRVADPAEVRTLEDHVAFYAEPCNMSNVDLLVDGERMVGFADDANLPNDSPRALVRAMVARLNEHGVDVFAADVTSPDIADAGLSVVKVYCPQLLPLGIGSTTQFLGGSRLASILDGASPNSDPHPFP